MSGRIEEIREELGGMVTPVIAATLASAYFTARALPENKDKDPDLLLAEVFEVFKACCLECSAMTGEAA